MSRLAGIDVGDMLGPATETIQHDRVMRFMAMRPRLAGDGRFTDPDAAAKLGLKGMLVPGPLQAGILARIVRHWAPEAHLTKLDLVFRRSVLQDVPVTFEAVVIDLNGSAVDLDLNILDSDGERLVTGSATLVFPEG